MQVKPECDGFVRHHAEQERPMSEVSSTSDDRTVNNTMRHAYRVLTDAEKASMQAIKDKGLEFHQLLDSLKTQPTAVTDDNGVPTGMYRVVFDRELTIAKERVEEAVMWAVKHVTA